MFKCEPCVMCVFLPPSHAVQLGLAGGECRRKVLVARASQYWGFSTRRRISAIRRCRKPGSMAVPPITTRFSDRAFLVSMGHCRGKTHTADTNIDHTKAQPRLDTIHTEPFR